MPKNADADVISKRHDTNLWAEIRTLYESKNKHPYEKIKTVLMAEFALEKFPSQRTVERRAKSEGWKRAISEGDRQFNETFSEEFWMCVQNIYESNPKLSYKRLRELVENELQCADFPSAQAVSAKAKAGNWARADALVQKNDAELKKLKQSVNRLVNDPHIVIYDHKDKKIKQHKNEEDEDEESQEDEGELLDFDVMTEIIDSEKRAIKNLLMTSQIKRRNMAEVILKARKRMSIMNDFSDILSDELALNFQLLNSTQFRQVMGEAGADFLKEKMKKLGHVASIFNELSFNRREALKFELSLYGVTIEDLQKAGETSKAVAMDDNTAFEAQREKLRQEKERIAERKRYIESGGLQSDVNEEMKKRMAEADIEDAEVIEVE